MITRFDEFFIPDVNSVSKEFWKMTTVVNWKKVIVDYKKVENFSIASSETNKKRKEIKEQASKRLCTNYEYSQVKKFEGELKFIYQQLYEFFKPLWLDSGKLGVSDDGYCDLITSVIGSGKKFTKECINNYKTLINMSKNRNYVENFSYLFSITENEYNEIRDKYDPIFKDTRKYNL